MKEKKQRVEYMTLDLSPARSWDTRKKLDEVVATLIRLGKDGWILISGIEYLKSAVFMPIIEEVEE